MEFSLLYPGSIPTASKTKTRASDKHAIRKVFHPQLKRLWRTHEQLRLLAATSAVLPVGSPVEMSDDAITKGQQNISSLFEGAGGYRFVPLVTKTLFLNCSLDILLLRPSENRFILQQGDIDGQLKTIFDALRMPNAIQEIGDEKPSEDEDPFFCLLEDDRLISQVKVTSQNLLLLPGERTLKANDTFAIVHVSIDGLYPTSIMNLPYPDLLEARANAMQEQGSPEDVQLGAPGSDRVET